MYKIPKLFTINELNDDKACSIKYLIFKFENLDKNQYEYIEWAIRNETTNIQMIICLYGPTETEPVFYVFIELRSHSSKKLKSYLNAINYWLFTIDEVKTKNPIISFTFVHKKLWDEGMKALLLNPSINNFDPNQNGNPNPDT